MPAGVMANYWAQVYWECTTCRRYGNSRMDSRMISAITRKHGNHSFVLSVATVQSKKVR